MTSTGYRTPTYGNYRQPKSAGIGKLSRLETAIMLAGILLVMIGFQFGVLPGAIMLVSGAVIFLALTQRDKHGRSRLNRLAGRRAHGRAARRRLNQYRSGPAGPTGAYTLPGLAAKTILEEYEDSFGRPFALLHHRQVDHVTFVIEVEPVGLGLGDPESIDAQVANWGSFLSGLSRTNDIVAAAVTVETAPDYGVRLRHDVDLHMHPDASPAAREMMAEVKATFPQSASTTRAWVSVTMSTWRAGGEKIRSSAEMGVDIGSRMAKFTEHLEICGAGDARPVSAQGLCEIIRTAYDPAIGEHIDVAHITGTVPPLSWNEIGPVNHVAGWEWYRHDSGYSKSWTMSAAPRGSHYSNVLEQLMAPAPEIDRKRITLLYRPVSMAIAMDVAENDVNKASARADSKKVNYRARGELASAMKTAEEVAKDAGLINFGLIATATILTADQAAAASWEMEGLAAAQQIVLRPAYGAQDVTFTAGLPLGIVLPDYVGTPQIIREAL